MAKKKAKKTSKPRAQKSKPATKPKTKVVTRSKGGRKFDFDELPDGTLINKRPQGSKVST